METRASYAAVGAFVLVLIFALLGFVLWLGSSDLDEDLQAYRIYFTGSLTGLSVGSTVRYQGVPVGTVTAIALDPAHPDRIPVTVEILEATPITGETVARLEQESFVTGVLYVQLTPGRPGSQRLSVPADEDVLPVIPSVPSSIQAVIDTLPEILENVSTLVADLGQLLNEENQSSLAEILDNVEALTASLAVQADDFAGLTDRSQSLISNLDGLVAELRVDMARLSDRLDATLAGAGGLTDDVELAIADVRSLAGSFTALGNQLAGLVEGIRPGVEDFGQNGLYEVTLMVSEIRSLAQRLSRVSTQFEQDPTQLIFGRSDQGVPVE